MSKSEFSLTDEQRAKLALALIHRSSSQTEHLSEGALAALIEHKGQDEELNVWKKHLGECSECYRVFLECAQWRLEFAEEQAALERQKAEKEKGWLALQLGRWRFLVSSMASVFVVAVLFYLMPANIPTPKVIQEQDRSVSLEQSDQNVPVDSPAMTKFRSKSMPQKLTPDRAHSPAAMASTDLAKGASGTAEEPTISANAAVSAQAGLVLDRTAPEAIATPNLQELMAKNEMAKASSLATAEEATKKQKEQRIMEAQAQSSRATVPQIKEVQSSASQAMAPEQDHANDQTSAERIEVTGSRIKADPIRDEFFALIDVEAYERGMHDRQSHHNNAASPETITILPESAETEMTSTDKKRYTKSRLLGEWQYAAKIYCAQESSSRRTSEFTSLVRRWPDLYTSLRLDTTQHSLWPGKINSVQILCKVSQEISVLAEYGE